MAHILYIVYLTAMLLCSQVLAEHIGTSTPNDSTASMINTTIKPTQTETDANIRRSELYNGLLSGYYKLALWTLEHFKTMLNYSITDLSILNETNHKINEKLSEFSDIIFQIKYIETATDSDIINKTFILLNACFEYLDKFNITAKPEPSAEDLLLDMTLIKNHHLDIKHEFWHSFVELLHVLYVKAEAYWNSLSVEQKAEDEEFKNWLTKFKNFQSSNAQQVYAEFTVLYGQ